MNSTVIPTPTPAPSSISVTSDLSASPYLPDSSVKTSEHMSKHVSNNKQASEEKVALVTGGNRGIGLATALALKKAGHKVAITYRSSLPAAATDHGLICVKCDVTDTHSVNQAIAETTDKAGGIDILVANAGITRDKLVLRMTEEDFTSVLDTNLTGSFRVAKLVARSMMKRRWGRIVFISSVSGIGGQAGQANYAASKAGVIGLARSMAKELASRNVTVNVVAPGPIDTDMLNALNTNQLEAITNRVPLGRVGTPEELAASVAFLASENAGYITGTVLAVDGGLSMG